MSALAVLLIAVGAGEVCRRLIHARWVAPVVAVVAIVACTLLGALWSAARFHGAAADRGAGPRGSAGHGSLALVAASHQMRRRCRDGPVGSVPGLDATTMVAQK
jgi:hypothetical protein